MKTAGIDVWLDIHRVNVLIQQPELLDMFDTYTGEARFGRAYIAPILQVLGGSDSILEMVCCLDIFTQLISVNFKVAALLPIGLRFSHFY